MSSTTAMRTGAQRVRFTVSFELTLMAFLIPAGTLFFDKPMAEIGMLSVILATKAMLINLIYNWGFDRFDAHYGRVASNRSHLGRIFHAIGFEVSLMLTSLPLYVWWLQVTYVQAFATDIVVTSFVVAYTYVFTLGYDRLYPVG